MLKTTPVFMPILPQFTPKWKVEIVHDSTTTDVTSRVRKGEFVRSLLSIGIGYFSIKVFNPNKTYSDLISNEDSVIFYADYANGTTRRFKGTIDKIVKDNINYLEISGRHVAYPITEKWISKASEATEAYSLVTDIFTDHFSSFTTNNISSSSNTPITKAWDSQHVLKILQDTCRLSSSDGYIDDDLDVHLFPENSVYNDTFAVAQGVNLIKISGFGVDNYDIRDRVTIIGQDGEGLPVLYTTGTGERNEKPIFNSNITNTIQAKELGDAKYSDLQEEIPVGKTISYGAINVNLGDNIIVSCPKQEIHGAYKIIQIKDIVGKENGYWKSELSFERRIQNISDIVEERIKKEDELVKLQNPNNLEYSYNFTFDDETNIGSKSNTEISEGRLQLTSGKSTGTMVTDSQTSLSGNNITQVELKIIGSDLTSSVFKISADNGVNYTTVLKNTLYSITPQGKYLKIKVTLNSDSDNPNPLLESLAVLYK